MLTEQIFRTIQSGKQDEWYIKVTDAALYMATGGFLYEANELLQALWKHKLPHDRNTWLPDLAFEVLWHTANEKPQYIPFGLTDIDTIEIQHRDYCSGDSYGYKMPDVEWPQLEGQDAFRQGSIYASSRNNQLPDARIELISLQLLEKSLDRVDGLAGHEICKATTLAAELAARNNKMETAIKMVKLWASQYHDNYLGYIFSVMACNRHVAPLLLKGIIANELKLNKVKCREFLDKAIIAIDERMKKGDTLVYETLNWDALLAKLNALAVNNYPEHFTDEQIINNWIGRLPAKDSAITEAEKRLGLQLPDDYKAFLKISNGFSGFPFMNPELLQVEEINFLKEKYKESNRIDLFEIIKDFYDEEKGTIEEYLERAIAISQPLEDIEVWMIRPAAEDTQWQCWYADKYGESRYKSFRYYFEEQIQQLEQD